MSSHGWTDVWNLFLELLSRESITVQIAVVLGAALIVVMALEGVRASFFPKQILKGMALRDAAPLAHPSPPEELQQDNMHGAWNTDPAPFDDPRVTVNSDTGRRSSPQQLRVIGQRKPS